MSFGLPKIIFVMALSLIAAPLYAHVAIVPGQAILNSKKSLDAVAYVRPCGAKVLGIVLDKKNDSQVIHLGVAVSLPEIACAGMPKPALLSASVLRYPASTRYEAYQENFFKTPLQFSRVNNLKYFKQKSQLQIVHHRSCHAIMNSLPVLKQSKTGVSIAVLEYRRFSEKSCAHTQATISLPAMLADSMKRLNTLQNQEKVADVDALPYDIRLKAISGFSAIGQQGLNVTFKRECNEAPIGVFIKKVKRQGKTKFLIAALAAYFPDQECQSKKSQLTSIKLPQLTLPTSQMIAVNHPRITNVKNLQVVKPQEVALRKTAENAQATASIQYFHDCDRHLGLVFASDRRNNLAVGILKKRESFRCSVGVESRVLQQPFIMMHTANPNRLYPLNLENQTAI